jgi:hypothetical protein
MQYKLTNQNVKRFCNSGEEIVGTLRLAVNAETEHAAISVLVGLSGVEVPVASAILTAIDPER